MSCDKNQINIVKNKDASWLFRLTNCDGNSIDITGWTFASLEMEAEVEGETVKVLGPKDIGQDEIQKLTYSVLPSTGTYKLKYKERVTAPISASATGPSIQAAINALPYFSTVTVGGDAANGFTFIFAGADGKRDQDLLEVVDSTLEDASSQVVTVDVVEQVKGVAENGIEGVDDATGLLRIKLSEEQTSKLRSNKINKLQSLVFCVRVGTEDLNIPIIKNILNVEASPFA